MRDSDLFLGLELLMAWAPCTAASTLLGSVVVETIMICVHAGAQVALDVVCLESGAALTLAAAGTFHAALTPIVAECGKCDAWGGRAQREGPWSRSGAVAQSS